MSSWKNIRRRSIRPGKEAVKKASLFIEGVYVPDCYTVEYNHDGTLAGRTPLHGAPATIRRRCLGELSPAVGYHICYQR